MPYRDAIEPITTSKTLGYVTLLALATGLYALIPLWKEYSEYRDLGDLPSQFHAALSLVLGWLLVFRTNTAYSRWWEARTLWGALVNASRNLACKLNELGEVPQERLRKIQPLLLSFPVALKLHLRSEVQSGLPDDIRQLVPHSQHVPQALVQRLYQQLGDWKMAEWIDGDELRIIDADLQRLLDICGGCERIQRTRIVKSYRVFARQCVLLFLATLPWGIVQDFGGWTIPLTMITAYFMLGLEIVAEHVEEPFGYDEDDLDLDGLCVTIQNSVNEVFEHRSDQRVS